MSIVVPPASRQWNYICASCRLLLRPRAEHVRPRLQHKARQQSTNGKPPGYVPIDDYYAQLLSQPLSATVTATRTAPKPPTSAPTSQKEAQLQKARVVFGSRLAGPAERRRSIDSKSTMIAGVLVPPRPEEPDNCCMSGCVNCVWDAYRDDIEEWAAKSAEARRKSMIAQGSQLGGSMDDDGGGSETNWDGRGEDGEGLFEGVPVGIREFMRTEKVLRERHKREGTSGG